MTRSNIPYHTEQMTSSIEDYAEQIRRVEVARSASEIEEVSAQLAEVSSETEVKIPEENFVAVFLPFFAGTGNPYNVDTTRWISMVGSPFRGAKLINARGDVVYDVPPLASDSALRLIDEKGPNMRNMLTQAQLYQTVTPQAGENYMREGLNAIDCIDIESLREANPVAVKWLELFKHYGVEPDWAKTVKVGSKEETTKKKDDKIDEDIIWDVD